MKLWIKFNLEGHIRFASLPSKDVRRVVWCEKGHTASLITSCSNRLINKIIALDMQRQPCAEEIGKNMWSQQRKDENAALDEGAISTSSLITYFGKGVSIFSSFQLHWSFTVGCEFQFFSWRLSDLTIVQLNLTLTSNQILLLNVAFV